MFITLGNLKLELTVAGSRFFQELTILVPMVAEVDKVNNVKYESMSSTI